MRKDDRDTIHQNFLGEEDGFVYFFYRPKLLEAHGPQDVERLYFVLHPLDQKKFRLVTIDSPQLPNQSDRFNMVTGRVLKVDDKSTTIQHALEEIKEQARGVISVTQGAARAAGEGVYTVVQNNNRTRLLYVMEMPVDDGAILESLGFNTEGDLEIGAYNPYYNLSDEEREDPSLPPIPEPLRTKLDNERIAWEDIPELLDYEGMHLALFRQNDELLKSMGRELHGLTTHDYTANILRDLKFRYARYRIDPLFTDEWR